MDKKYNKMSKTEPLEMAYSSGSMKNKSEKQSPKE